MVEQEKRISYLNFWLEVAQAMNVGKSTIDLWAKQLKSERNGVSPTATSLTEDKLKIRELEKRIRRMEKEKEILKKATALLMSDAMIKSY